MPPTPTGMPPPESSALTSELRDRLRYVEGQLEAERQAHAEARRIIAGLVERIPAIEAPQEPQKTSRRSSRSRSGQRLRPIPEVLRRLQSGLQLHQLTGCLCGNGF
jgi:hypothetical protein